MIRALYFSLILFSCTNTDQGSVEIVDSTKLVELQSEGIVVFDIRTPDEYNNGHIPNVTHVDFYEEDFIGKLESLTESKEIVIHCAKGGRSAKAAKQLMEAGFTKIYDYSGGFNDWKEKGLEVEY